MSDKPNEVSVEEQIEAVRHYCESGNAQHERLVFLKPGMQAAILSTLRRYAQMESALKRIDVAFEGTDYTDRASEKHFEEIRDIALAALKGPSP